MENERLGNQQESRLLMPRRRNSASTGGLRDLAIEYQPTEALRAAPKNPRLHSDKQIYQIERSIEAFGLIVPLLVDGERQVIAGHGRLAAARRLNLARIPTIRIDHLSEAQIRAFMIADNKLTENSEWDIQLLGEQFKALAEADVNFSVEVTGFSMAEIDLTIGNLSTPIQGDDPADVLPERSVIQVTQAGDLWHLGKHRVLCGNALRRASYELLLGDRLANMVFTDPPYNVPIAGNVGGKGKVRHGEFLMASGETSDTEFNDFLTSALSCLAKHSSSASLLYVCMDWRHMKQVVTAGENNSLALKNVCVWVKDNGGMGGLYRSQHEFIFVFKNGEGSHRNNVELGRFGRSRTNVWHYPGANSFFRSSSEGNLLALHPTVKPVAMVADAILDCSARNDVVLDPFLGSGTTLIAAERTGRVCCGLELDPRYVDTIVRRWQALTREKASRFSDERNFDDCEKEAACERRQEG